MAQPLSGPKDVLAVWVDGGVLTVVDARANLWTYDTTIVTDANGEAIFAPAAVTFAEVGHGDRVLVVDDQTTAWIYEPTAGRWRKGSNIDTLLPGEAANTTNPWKRHANVLGPGA